MPETVALVHACDRLTEQALVVALGAAEVTAYAWDEPAAADSRPTALVVAARADSAPACDADCEERLAHWRDHHPGQPVVRLVTALDSECGDWQVEWSESLPTLLASVAAAAKGDQPRRTAVTGPTLTPRERAVLELLASGSTNSRIAAALSVSVSTVRTHVQAVLQKLDAPDRVAAVAAARRAGLLDVVRTPEGP